MNQFKNRCLPYNTVDTDGDLYAVVAILDDDKIVTARTTPDGCVDAQVWHDDGYPMYGTGYRLLPPKPEGYHEFQALHPNVRELILYTMTWQKKIAGIKALRGLLGLGLVAAKELYEHLEYERA